MGNRNCICNAVVRWGKEIVTFVVLSVFLALLCLLLIAIGIVWSLADCIAGKLEKSGCL